MVKFIKAPSCIGCAHHSRWSQASNYNGVVTEFDRCSAATSQSHSKSGAFIESLLQHPEWYKKDNVNPTDCERKSIREIIKSNRMWVHLYFKGRERDWIVVEPNKHEIRVEAGWFVRKVFGVADRFHKWQDARDVKRAEKQVARRKAELLTHIVRELPRL